MSPRHVPASVTELSRIGLFASIPGETLKKLAERMTRHEVAAGMMIADRESLTNRFYVLVSGLASVTAEHGPRVLRPGDSFGGEPGVLAALAMTPCVIASCDQSTFEELVRPLLKT